MEKNSGPYDKSPDDIENDGKNGVNEGAPREIAIGPDEFEGEIIPLTDLISISKTGEIRGGLTWQEALKPFIDDLSHLPLDRSDIVKLEKYIAKNNSGLSNKVPLRCAGEACPFAMTCPFVQLAKESNDPRKIPVGKECPIEQNKMISIAGRFADSYQIERNDYAQFMMCVELAVLYVFEDRLDYYLASPEYACLLEEDIVGVTKDGEILSSKKPSPAIELKLKIAQRRSKILNDMVATRRAMVDAAKHGVGDAKDMSTLQSDLNKKITEIERKIEERGSRPKIKDADYTVVK